ncbi:MAG TPA: NINE protein [Burkholderiaceae bacterium]|jgi:TM2 domain-containing membrane protein YozV|nr:NINE protein [Burkholderiaceae bacterium]
MTTSHKSKTIAVALASTLGGLGLHRFYLGGGNARWGWLHVSAIPLSLIAIALFPDQPVLFSGSPFVLSVLSGFLEALIIGLIPDDEWDALYNPRSGRQSTSGWPLALALVLTLGIGSTAVIAAMARAFDLFFTGGAYG